MPHPCVVCGRSRMNPNNREEDYMFFGFPVNYDDRCKKWLEFCGREDLYKLTKKQLLQRMVCSKHFQEKDFLNEYLDRLNCTAVPTIYDPKQSLYNITCVLCGRYRKDPPDANYDGTTFHHFPGEEFRCLKWLDFVGIDSYYRLTRKEILYCYICSNHFIKSQFLPGYRNRLVDNAVPVIRNPDSLEYELVVDYAPPSADTMKPISEKAKKLEPLPPEVLESQACAACGRSRSDPTNRIEKYKFHPFPAYEIGRCLRWCQFLGREDLLKMSPNQIRKLVLCSKHFLSGQSFQKVGPCDAVPTIKDFEEIIPNESSNCTDKGIKQVPKNELINVNLEHLNGEWLAGDDDKRRKKKEIPVVSSKKPFIANKPMPLAKKRGKSRRPTLITIPKPPPPLQPPQQMIIDNRILRKLPLPPASSNCDLWKFTQIQPNQIQPLTIANNITPLTNVNAANVKKVILPFTGNISNLGKPIPVSSLESIPPGLLIKIDLPDVNNSLMKVPKQEKLVSDSDNKSVTILEKRKRGRKRKIQNQIYNDTNEQLENPVDHNLEELLIIKESDEDEETHLEEDIEEITIEAIDENYNDGSFEEEEEMIGQEEILEIESDEGINEEIDSQNQYIFDNVDENDEQEGQKYLREEHRSNGERRIAERRLMAARTRRTLLPIRSQINQFLRNLQPQIRRLPQNARTRIKCFILAMINNHL